MGDDSEKTPWSKISESPSEFFSSEFYPAGFTFQDPSRMGATSVKLLLKHLRERQETYGVNAFHFENVYRNKKFEPAKYPAAMREVIDAGPDALTWPKPDNRTPEKMPLSTSDTATANSSPTSSQALPRGSPTVTSGMEISSPVGEIHISGAAVSDPSPAINWTLAMNPPNTSPTPILVVEPSPTLNAVHPTDSAPTPLCHVTPSNDSLINIDPSLLVPEGDPFSHLRKTVMSLPSPSNTDAFCSRANPNRAACSTDLDLRFKPPKFSPFTTPKKTSPSKRKTMDAGSPTPKASPSKRKWSDLEETTTPTRSGRKIKTPKRFRQD